MPLLVMPPQHLGVGVDLLLLVAAIIGKAERKFKTKSSLELEVLRHSRWLDF